jgi:hypothetical protein
MRLHWNAEDAEVKIGFSFASFAPSAVAEAIRMQQDFD